MVSNLILIEHETQVRDALNCAHSVTPLWAAMAPGAMYELWERGIDFIIPENYYSPQELKNLGEESRNRVKTICTITDELLRQSISGVERYNLTPTLFYYHAINLVMNTLALRVFQIKRLIAEIKPQTITTYASQCYPFAAYGIGFDNRESLYGYLLSLKGWDTQVNLIPPVAPIENILSQSKMITTIQWFKNTVVKVNWLYNIAIKLRYLGWKGLKPRYKKGLPSVLIYGGYYDWLLLLGDLTNAGLKTKFIPHGSFTSKKDLIGDEKQQYLISELDNNTVFRNQFILEGIDTYDLWRERISYIVRDNVNSVINSYEEATNFFKNNDIDAILTSVKATPDHHAVCLAARDNGIPILNWQHGSAGYYEHHTLEYLDLLSTDIYLAYGEGVCQQLSTKNKEFQVLLKSTGAVSLDKIRHTSEVKNANHSLSKKISRIVKAENKLCLYATSSYFENDWYAGYDPPPSDNTYYQTQLTLMTELLKITQLSLILKLSPSYANRKPPWLSHDYSNYPVFTIFNEYTYTELLNNADLIILDWPSTTLLQAAATDKPLFIITKHLHILPEALRMLRKRAVCDNEPKYLINYIENYTNTGVYPADIHDNTFLKAYGTHLDDNHSSKRAVSEVLQAIGTK